LTEKNYTTLKLTTKVVTANYDMGNLNGNCNYTETENSTNKVLSKSTSTFKNNTPIGNYFYSINDGENDFTINIMLNKNGLADSTSSIKYKYNNVPYEYLLKYKNGILYTEIQRNMSNGKIIKRQDRSKFNAEMSANYDSTLNAAFISYSTFSDDDKPSIINYKQSDNTEISERIAEDTIAFKNIPFRYVAGGYMSFDFGTFWNLGNATNFWIDNSEKKRLNPLYYTEFGTNKIEFLPAFELVIPFDVYLKVINKAITNTVTNHKTIRADLLTTLKSTAIQSIEFINVKDTANTTTNYSISLAPITNIICLCYEKYYSNRIEKFQDQYFNNSSNEINANFEIENLIADIQNKKNPSLIEPCINSREIKEMAQWLGLRIATQTEIDFAITSGTLKQNAIRPNLKVFWFAK
jgi:hypothetical protein